MLLYRPFGNIGAISLTHFALMKAEIVNHCDPALERYPLLIRVTSWLLGTCLAYELGISQCFLRRDDQHPIDGRQGSD